MGPIPRRTFATSLGAALALQALPGGAGEALPPIPTLPLAVAVAQEGGRPVRDDAWIDARIAEAERIFGPLGVHVRKTAQRALDGRFAHLETRKDRDALDGERAASVVNVFVVASLRDVDDPSLYRMGVHWRNTRTPRHRYLIVAASALIDSLAHELGHFNGLDHSPVENNLMSYNRTSAPSFLSPAQATAVRTFARFAFSSGELAPVPDPSALPRS
jgi:hypothetical protein